MQDAGGDHFRASGSQTSKDNTGEEGEQRVWPDPRSGALMGVLMPVGLTGLLAARDSI